MMLFSGHVLLPAVLLLFSRCAQIVPLSGGDKDVQPPKVMAFIPANGSVGFSGKNIQIDFDEYIQLRDVQNQVVITPQLKELPEISAKDRSLSIKFTEALRPNTTYHINFGNAISDIHEANPLTGFEYVFSTGESIDSLKIIGTLTDAFTLQPVRDAVVMLYENDKDSSVYGEKPAYLAKSDNNGNYVIPFLKAGQYKVFALKDNNRNFIYDADELIGFYPGMFKLERTDSVNMHMFREDPSRCFLKKLYAPNYGKAELIFNMPLEENAALSIYNRNGMLEESKYKSRIGLNRDTVVIYYYDVFDDTLHPVVKHGMSSDTTKLFAPSREEVERLKSKKRLPLDIVAAFNPGVLQPPFLKMGFRTSRMYKQADPSKIIIVEGTDTLQGDRLKYRLAEPDSFYITNKLVEDKDYQLYFYPGAFTDYLGVQSDTTIYKFRIRLADYYAALTVNLTVPSGRDWLFQLYNSKGKLAGERAFTSKTESGTRAKLKFDHLEPDTYSMKLIEDRDANKKFSTGNYGKKTFPERVISSSQQLKLTGDWEMETDWKIEN